MREAGYLDLALSRTELDRSAHLRSDSENLNRLWDKAEIALLFGEKFTCDESKLRYFTASEIEKLGVIGVRYFLGLTKENIPHFVLHCSPLDTDSSNSSAANSSLINKFSVNTLRNIGAQLNDLDIGVAAHSLALSQWHYNHPRCAKCGEATQPILGGAARECASCGSQHHPRTDPAVIVLVIDKSERVLLGHQKIWPINRFSTFAGFVEPGESFESCVRREVMEEAGVFVTSMKYLGSQPWPFPASIMIAYEAHIDDPDQARADGEEIAEIRWFTRSSMKQAVQEKSVILPPTISVARAMINRWYGESAEKDLTGGDAWRN